MTLTFNKDPCTDLENEYKDNNLFKRSVLRILCALKTGLNTITGKVSLLDSTGADITSTNPLPVTATFSPIPGGATAANQALEIAALNSLDSKVTVCNTNNVAITSMPPITIPAGGATAANQVLEIAALTSIDGKITACDTGNVTIVNAVGAGAVNIQDGGNSITVDGSVAVSSFPAGIATSANQATEISSLSSIDLVTQLAYAILTTLKTIVSWLTRGIWIDAASGSIRSIVSTVASVTSVTGVTTVSTVTNVSGAGGFLFYAASQSISNTTWILQVRNRVL